MLAPQKESIFGCSCRLWLLSWRRARIFARSCSLLSKYLPISWKQRKEQSHAQCHVTHRIRIFDKISEHVKVAKSVDIAVPELAVTQDLILSRQKYKIIQNTILSVQAAETQSDGSFHSKTTISSRFHNQNASTCGRIMITYFGFRS